MGFDIDRQNVILCVCVFFCLKRFFLSSRTRTRVCCFFNIEFFNRVKKKKKIPKAIATRDACINKNSAMRIFGEGPPDPVEEETIRLFFYI